jgi:hypothetical protein
MMTKKYFDIESDDPYPLQDWQLKMLEKFSAGFQAGEMSIISSGRRAGKSWYYELFQREQMQRVKYRVEAEDIVDGEQWYTVRVAEGLKDISAWLRSLDKNLAVEHKSPIMRCDSMFDIHEKIYMMMELKFK